MRRLLWIFVALLTVRAAGAQTCFEPGVLTLAHLCNWHEKAGGRTSWQFATTFPLYSDGECVPDPRAPSGFDCFTGYRSLDARTIAHHNAQMCESGVRPLISWWGRVGTHLETSGDLYLDQYFAVPSPIKIGILYEVVSLLQPTQVGVNADGSPSLIYDFGDSADSENAQRFIADVTYLNEKYVKRYPERFLRIRGKPILFIWLSHAFTGRFDLAAEKLKQTVPIYIIGSDFGVYLPNEHNPFPATIRGLDAVSAYTVYNPDVARRYGGHMSREYVDQYTLAWIAWDAWIRVNAPQVKLIPPFHFTFKVNNPNPPMAETTPAEARYLLERIRALIDEGRKGCTQTESDGEQSFALGVSWNEAFEGTSFEPTQEYLDKIAKYCDPKATNPPAECRSLLALFRDVFGPPLVSTPPCPVP